MTDWLIHPPAQVGNVPRAKTTGAVRLWLWSLAALVLAMVVVGGATRLTESGLSITEWKPIIGVLPPLSHAQWLAEFDRYKQIPQYRELFPDMDLAGFQFIYAWEWTHRLLGRLLGFAVALPLAFFWATGRLTPRLKFALVGLLALIGLQGFVGWWMVSSGLSGRVEVAQERLAIHLLLASATLAWLVWLATGLGTSARAKVGAGTRAFASLLVVLVLVQIGLGALVAGLRAGLTYNTWPLMDGHFVPPLDDLARLSPWWSNLLDNVTTVQFAHRMTAYAVLAAILVYSLVALRQDRVAGRRGMRLLTLGIVQAAIGIVTLLWSVPLHAALCHQAIAMVLLGAAVWNRRLLEA
jgi:cytochrome c oxidase assembly protein subunit 15